MKVRKAAFFILIVAVPAVMFANVWFAYRYHALQQEISELEDVQLELIERNKRIITGISILRSPGRIVDEARELGMENGDWSRIRLLEGDS